MDNVLLPLEKEAILAIPVSLRGGQDCLTWHFDKLGSYTVSSGYKVALGERIIESASNSSSTRKWWTTLWNLNIPPKKRIFI